MLKYDLAGEWRLQDLNNGHDIMGRLPGCNYLDFMNNGLLENPFWTENEVAAAKIAENDFLYSRQFPVDTKLVSCDRVDLVLSGVDTIAEIHLNSGKIAETRSAHRSWRFDITKYLIHGENLIEILLKSPNDYMKRECPSNPFEEKLSMPSTNVSKLRKPHYHFGWDWGPVLPPAGISGEIYLDGIKSTRLEQVKIQQVHTIGHVSVSAEVYIECVRYSTRQLSVKFELTEPGGRTFEAHTTMKDGCAELNVMVKNPMLWWCNGLGEQPLYQAEITLLDSDDATLDTWAKPIGLRTITLDTSADKWGNNFRFLINGIPIFVKGANWIPPDSFITRTTKEDLDFYIKSANHANMNMLRVWGGGYYESERFYDLCDKYGILVWQDFAFACNKYPLTDKNFLVDVEGEVKDNVRRLRHHASLALWCGNNELFISDSGKDKKNGYAAVLEQFFYTTLHTWLQKDDTVTPYWPGSPCSGTPANKANGLNRGDTHLWQVWHGLRRLDSFRTYPARFCSEYGVESLPSMSTIRSFTGTDRPAELGLTDPTILAHQKCGGGNEKMLFYLLSKFRNPAEFSGLIYLTQIIQAETVRMAMEFWRRNTGRCNGSLYWQYNDCWPAVSWAGIDYAKQYKAVQYKSRYFNAMRIISVDMYPDSCDLHVVNDYPEEFAGNLHWKLIDFSGDVINKGEFSLKQDGIAAMKVKTLVFKDILRGTCKREVVLFAELLDSTGKAVSRCGNLLVADKNAFLKRPNFKTSITVNAGIGVLTIKTDTYARYVYVEIDGITQPLSDNFFDIPPNETVTLHFPVPSGIFQETLNKNIHITTLANIEYKGTRFGSLLRRLAIWLKPMNILMWLVLKYI
jgi:beta-mannosidase